MIGRPVLYFRIMSGNLYDSDASNSNELFRLGYPSTMRSNLIGRLFSAILHNIEGNMKRLNSKNASEFTHT